MFGKQLLLIDTFGQFAFVSEHNAVIVHFHLCMHTHIVTVYNDIANSLTQHILRYFQLLYTCYPFVVNRRQKGFIRKIE